VYARISSNKRAFLAKTTTNSANRSNLAGEKIVNFRGQPVAKVERNKRQTVGRTHPQTITNGDEWGGTGRGGPFLCVLCFGHEIRETNDLPGSGASGARKPAPLVSVCMC